MYCTPRLSQTLQQFGYRLSIWALMAVVSLCVRPLYAEWVNIDGKIENGLTVYTVYLDADSIRRTGNTVTLWVLYDYIANGHVIYWLVVAATCAFIAYGRLVLRPF